MPAALRDSHVRLRATAGSQYGEGHNNESRELRHAMPDNAVMSVGKANVNNNDIAGETLYTLLQAWCSRTLIAIR